MTPFRFRREHPAGCVRRSDRWHIIVGCPEKHRPLSLPRTYDVSYAPTYPSFTIERNK